MIKGFVSNRTHIKTILNYIIIISKTDRETPQKQCMCQSTLPCGIARFEIQWRFGILNHCRSLVCVGMLMAGRRETSRYTKENRHVEKEGENE